LHVAHCHGLTGQQTDQRLYRMDLLALRVLRWVVGQKATDWSALDREIAPAP
jgi:hypothetical protein